MHKGTCTPFIHVVIPNRSETVISLSEGHGISPSDEMLRDVEKLFGYKVVTFQ